MKYCILLSFAMVCCIVRSQEDNTSIIKATYALIEQQIKDSTLDIRIIPIECYDNPELGEITFYSDSTHLHKTTYTRGYEHYSETTTIYYLNNEPIFVFDQSGYWQFTGNKALETRETIEERRFYLTQNTPFKCLTKSFTYLSDKPIDTNQIPNKEVACSSTKWATLDSLTIPGLEEQYLSGSDRMDCTRNW